MTTNTPPSLSMRPRADTLNVSDILALAESGKMRVPRFQTGLRWQRRNVTELFDSLLRGFPIGNLLLWKNEAERATLTFGPVTIEANRVPDAFFIVDGQQRVTALVGALRHPDPSPAGDTHAVWVNLRDGTFEVPSRIPTTPEWIPLNIVGQRPKLQQWARHAGLGNETDALIERAFEIEERIIRYEIPAYIVEGTSHDTLRLIFSRTNSSGVPLQEDQVFEALFGTEGRSAKPLQQMSTWLNEQTNFGELKPGWLLRCVKAVGELDPRRSFDEGHPPDETLLQRTRMALRRAINLLQAEAGFWHASVLPYRFPLIVLARFFDLHPVPDPRTRTLLIRWLWRGAIAGTHSASNHAAVVANLGDIGEDEHDSVQRLLKRVPNDAEKPSATKSWSGRAASTRLYATVMLDLEPIHPVTEQPLGREELLAMLGQSELKDVFRCPLESCSDKIAARVLLPFDYKAEELRSASDEVLLSLGIDASSAVALRKGDGPRFEKRRAKYLSERLARLLNLKAESADNDRPPMRIVAGT